MKTIFLVILALQQDGGYREITQLETSSMQECQRRSSELHRSAWPALSSTCITLLEDSSVDTVQ